VTIRAWRIVPSRFAGRAFLGEGARIAGGRWNSPGGAAIYTSSSASLATLELLVHIQSQDLLKRDSLFGVSFEETLVTEVDPRDLPKSWRRLEPTAETRRIGDEWLADATSAVLRVPSVIMPTEWNYLLNPAHPDFARIKIGPRTPVLFDPRLLKTPGS
jgi:RES domain-containing protein